MKTNVTPQATVTRRLAKDRGRADHGWLQARFTFSFAEYFDPDHMGFRALRVMNNDTIAPGGGFPLHPHKDMEIFTYVIEGELQHRDSLGNGAVIRAGDLQYMSAGSGIRHSEFNPSRTQSTRLYQIWIKPSEPGGTPRYEEKPLRRQDRVNQLVLLFSGDGREASTAIRQDADLYFGHLTTGSSVTLPASSARPHAWIQVIQGSVSVLGNELKDGDGLALEETPNEVPLEARADSELLVFRLG